MILPGRPQGLGFFFDGVQGHEPTIPRHQHGPRGHSAGNTAHHLDYLGNDIMSPAATFTARTRTGTDFQRFSPFDINYLRNRQVYDEAK